MATWQIARADDTISLVGELRIAEAAAMWRTLRQLASTPAPRLDLDLSQLTVADGTVMALLVEFRRSLIARGTPCELIGAPPSVLPMLRLYRGDKPALALPLPKRKPNRIEYVGKVATVIQYHIKRTFRRSEEKRLLDAPIRFLQGLTFPGIDTDSRCGNGSCGVILCGEDVTRAPLHFSAKCYQRFNQYGGLNGHVQATCNAGSFQGF